MSAQENLLSVIDETLALLERANAEIGDGPAPQEPLPSLLKQCQEVCAVLDEATPEPVRTIHHFACTGGTLLSRCIEAMPNTVLLSEIDPYSTLPLRSADFAPYDLLRQSQTSLRPLDDNGIEETFLGSLAAMHKSYTNAGRRLVIRDHTHSQFCMEFEPAERPLIRDILKKRFTLYSLVTVRHPLDSFLSLRLKKWVMFAPDTLEEYCRRYLLFLDAYADAPLLRYEDFVANPDAGTRKMAEALELPYTDHWRDLLPVIEASGDSGRASNDIAPRVRREVSTTLLEEIDESTMYAALCDRLGYETDAGSPAVASKRVVD